MVTILVSGLVSRHPHAKLLSQRIQCVRRDLA